LSEINIVHLFSITFANPKVCDYLISSVNLFEGLRHYINKGNPLYHFEYD